MMSRQQQQMSLLDQEAVARQSRSFPQHLRDAGWKVDRQEFDWKKAPNGGWRPVGERGAPTYRCSRPVGPGLVFEFYLQVGLHPEPEYLEKWIEQSRGRGAVYACFGPGEFTEFLEWYGRHWGWMDSAAEGHVELLKMWMERGARP